MAARPRAGAMIDACKNALEAPRAAMASRMAGKINVCQQERPEARFFRAEPGPPPRVVCAVGWKSRAADVPDTTDLRFNGHRWRASVPALLGAVATGRVSIAHSIQPPPTTMSPS